MYTSLLLLHLLLLHTRTPQSHASPLPVATPLDIDMPTTKPACKSQAPLTCTVHPTGNHTATGTIYFFPVWHTTSPHCRVRITARFQNLTPGKHGFHIHTFGDISSADGSSTGPHFSNPQLLPTKHGFSANLVRHWGDFGNLNARHTESGPASYTRVDHVISLGGILGRGVTVHEGADKGPMFQTSGDAGNRIATGVIGFANPALL